MNPQPQNNRSSQPAGDNQGLRGGRKPKPRRSARKLFEPDAEPLDSAVPPLPSIRQPRRQRLWLLAALFALAVGSPLALVSQSEPSEPNQAPTNAPPTELAEEEPLTNGLPHAEDVNMETNGFAETNEFVVPVVPGVREPAGEEHSGNEMAPFNPAASGNAVVPATPPPASQPSAPSTASPGRKQAEPSPRPSASAEATKGEERQPAIASRSTSPDFAAFQIITQRNIFDPNRAPRRAQTNTTARKPAAVDAFSLVGIMSYEKGTFAFFDGTSSDYRKALKEEDSIANFKIQEIDSNTVKLASTDHQLELRVGMQLRREDRGEWRVAEPSGNTASYTSSNSTSGSKAAPAADSAAAGGSGDGNADEVLKRLMQRREQE
jgi:hypothetical protein